MMEDRSMTETKPAPAEGMRELDPAAGGGQVPIGPLGGPTPKTREQLLAEQAAREQEAAEADKAATNPLT
jgi:hypothetical protein